MKTPEAIVQHHLDVTGRALTLGDMNGLDACFGQVLTLRTSLGDRQLATNTDLAATFGRVRWYFKGMRLTQFERRILFTMEITAEMFVSVHETRLLRNGIPVAAPYKTLSTTAQVDGVWRIVDTCTSDVKSPDFQRALYGRRLG